MKAARLDQTNVPPNFRGGSEMIRVFPRQRTCTNTSLHVLAVDVEDRTERVKFDLTWSEGISSHQTKAGSQRLESSTSHSSCLFTKQCGDYNLQSARRSNGLKVQSTDPLNLWLPFNSYGAPTFVNSIENQRALAKINLATRAKLRRAKNEQARQSTAQCWMWRHKGWPPEVSWLQIEAVNFCSIMRGAKKTSYTIYSGKVPRTIWHQRQYQVVI